MSEAVSRETGTAELTTDLAALMVGVSEATVRKWVEREHLKPINPGRKPLRFREYDVWMCARERLTKAQRERLYGAWDTILARDEAPVRSEQLSDD